MAARLSKRDENPGEPKADSAFKTISEVSSALDVPQHVLRFWETKFKHIQPVKRRGGRRYYRPDDVEHLRVIQTLLHKEGFTIKGAIRHFAKHGTRTTRAMLQAQELKAAEEMGIDPTAAPVRPGKRAMKAAKAAQQTTEQAPSSSIPAPALSKLLNELRELRGMLE
ncbi:MerR family transcriptional regulator [bacterium]|nr:MerR family transcriptional regulator [bacterium]